MKATFDKFTVLIPTFERGEAVVSCVNGILAQERGDCLNILVSDNASSDGSWETIQQKLSQHPNVTLIQNSENIGFQGNYLKVIKSFTTDYGVLMSDEDWLDLEKLAEINTYIEETPSVSFISPQMEHQNALYRGREQVADISKEEFWISSFYITGLIYERDTTREAVVKIGEKHLLAEGQVYPQCLISSALLAMNKKATWLPILLGKNMMTLQSRLNDSLSVGTYHGLQGRTQQVVLFERFFSEMISISDSELEKVNWQEFRQAWMENAPGHIRNGFSNSFPNDLNALDEHSFSNKISQLNSRVAWLEEKRAELKIAAKENDKRAKKAARDFERCQSAYQKIRRSICWKLARPFHSIEKRIRRL